MSTKRNILVHNEGVWSQSSKKDLIETNYYDKIVVGESIDRNYEDFQEACEDIELAIKYLYERLCNKFQFLYKYDFIKSV